MIRERYLSDTALTRNAALLSASPGILRRKSGGPRASAAVPSSVHEAIKLPGQPLDAVTRASMEPRFGQDFSHVRIHTDSQAAHSALAVDALAYTVGRHVVFGAGHYAPQTRHGDRLLAHELTHVMQQNMADSQITPLSGLAINQPGDAYEREADTTADRVMAGMSVGHTPSERGLAVQRETPGDQTKDKPEEKKDAGDVIVGGLKEVVEQAKDNNPKVKKVLIDPLKDRLKHEWNRLETGEKAATIGFGAATLGLAGGGLLSDPSGRKQLEGLNLAAPLTLIPYMPLSNFKYTLPSGDSPDKRLFKFETGFKADDLINLHTERRGLPKMTLGVNMQWGYDPSTERLSILGGDASLGLVPGLSLSAGVYKDILRPPQTFLDPQGQLTQVKKSIPEFNKPEPIPDVRIMLTVDLLKFKPGDLVRQIRGIFK